MSGRAESLVKSLSEAKKGAAAKGHRDMKNAAEQRRHEPTIGGRQPESRQVVKQEKT